MARTVRTSGDIYGEAKTFLSIHEYEAVDRWANEVMNRPAVKRAKMVNRTWGEEGTNVPNRHSRDDFPRAKSLKFAKFG